MLSERVSCPEKGAVRMKEYRRVSLNKRLMLISLAVLIPMLLVTAYLLFSLYSATGAYVQITESVSYANRYSKEFKEQIDDSIYFAIIGRKNLDELGTPDTGIGSIETVNPYECIDDLDRACTRMSKKATVEGNRNQITRVRNSLKSLEKCVGELEEQMDGNATYEENIRYWDENITSLTTLIQEGIQEYIYVETMNLDTVRGELDTQNARTFTVCVLVSGVAVIIALVMTTQASRSITVPIRKLCDVAARVAEGDFTVKTKVENTDEIAMLTESFNDMTTEIGRLVEDIKKKQENLHITETKLLQAQINPHFLYNTLDTIVWLAEEKKNEQVVSMVTALSDFFRTTLSKGRDFITVREERSHIDSYLKIQQFRYQDIMEYNIDIDEDLYDYMIPKLTLQPLVENALYHGVKNKRGRGVIWITGEKEGDKIIFKVLDNGKGMTEEELEKLRKNIKREKNEDLSDGFGLANVNQRIRHYYGEECGLSFNSHENEGTEATITLQAKNIPPFA